MYIVISETDRNLMILFNIKYQHLKLDNIIEVQKCID